jgi:thiol-disulfide isomerase/thioredoxin
MKNIVFFFILILMFSCTSKTTQKKLVSGPWLFQLEIDNENPKLNIPFNVNVLNPGQIIVRNADERIEVNEISSKGDSVFIKMPVFGSEFRGKILNNLIKGEYFNYNKSKISPIPFTAEFGVIDRFKIIENPTTDFSGTWQASFISGENTSPAIGVFKQTKNFISGTFQTETGDYRYLQGIVNGNRMQLSCFDGAHAFLFTATETNGKLDGLFYSGNTWKQKWVAEKTEYPVLGDMKSLTFLKPGYDKLTFAFPNDKGDTISLEDKKFRNKIVIVQLFGTWCPNCMDETRYLVELYKKYNSRGLEIIGLDFEPKTDIEYFKKRISRFRKDLNVPYELVLAGPANKKLAAQSMPMLNNIISYPTAIFIDKNGKVREIHTGFSGPGTGKDFRKYKKETEDLIEKLLNE